MEFGAFLAVRDDGKFRARGSRGKADPPDSKPGSLGRAIRLAPTFRPQSIFSDALLWYGSQPGAIPSEGSTIIFDF